MSLETRLCTISLSFHCISTAQRDFFFFFITLSFSPSPQKLTAEEEKENQIQNNKGVLVPLLPPDLNPLRTLLWAKALVSFVSPLSSLENTKLKINRSSIRLLFCLFKNVEAWAQSSGGNSLLTQRRINLRKWLRLWQLWTGICSCAQAYCFNWETSPQQKPQPQNVTTRVKHPGHLVTQKSWHLGSAVAAGLAGAVEMFINCVGLRDVFWFCKLLGSSCLPVYRPASTCSHSTHNSEHKCGLLQFTTRKDQDMCH